MSEKEVVKHKPDSELTEQEMLDNAINLAFEGDRARFDEFCRVLKEGIPEGTAVVLGGSSVMGHSYKEDAPYDAEGPKSSDIDLYLIGAAAISHFQLDGFWIPEVHSHPIRDGDDDFAPGLNPLRQRLKEIAGREVTLQASQSFYHWFREKLLGQPYLLLVGELGDKDAAGEDA